MANKFSSLIFTEEGKDVMTKALADKGQMSIINAYTFTVSLTKDLTYSQISGLNPKQTKPMGTVTTDLTTNTVESRLIIDNRDVTADYNLKGIAITGVYGTDNYVLGIINTNETTLVPAYNGQSAQTINLDVSFAISDTSIVTVNTQYAGMLTVADYIALQKYIDQRDAKKADDTAAVHKTGNETINDIKTFMKIIVGSVSGNSGTSDRVNTLAINADVALSSLNNGVYLSTNASKTTSDKPTGAAETYVFVKESNVERFTDISNGQSYFRVKNGSTYTAWNRFSTAAELSNVDASAVHKTGNETIGGSKTFSSAIIANLQGNADTATKLKTARTISFSGAATGTGTFDGSGNVDIALTESAITRTNTSSAQSLAVGGTVTIIDSITTNTSGEITGVNVKTATMPSVYPPNNDSNLVHKSGAETIGGSKTFTDGLSGALAGNATSATKLANARKINGENFDGSADINVDPVVQVISTNKDVFTLDNGFYYYSNVSATNKPSGSSNYFVVEVIQSGNNGFMQLVDSNNNAWWTTKTGGAWSAWKAVANDALVAHLDTAETFTGKKTFSAGLAGELTGNAATATTLKTARKIGGVSFDGTQDIDLAGVNKTGNQDTTGKSARADMLNTRPATFNDISVVTTDMYKYAGNWSINSTGTIGMPNIGWSIMEVIPYPDNRTTGIIKLSASSTSVPQNYIGKVGYGSDLSWVKLPDDSTVVHNTGSENVSGAKNFFDVLTALSGIKGDVTGSLKGNADTATRLATTRKIGGVPFDGTADISLPGVNAAGNQSTTGNAATATKWQTARTLALTGDVTGSATIDGSGNVSIVTTGSNLVHKTGAETIGGDKTFTGNVNVSGTLSSTDTYLRVGKPILSPIISSSVVMWYGWKVYYYVHNGVVTYQIQTNSSTIPAGTKSNEKLPAAARPIYKTFVPLAYGGQGFAINIDGTFENYTGVEISGASWASATSHVLNL
ncbi:beta strand repeat-containing protein [Weissella confusa]|uniref:beta strand repeat-containing protein n=1 Tax=Weissella confusa TaxID=1583 RepID=UPI001300861F|nr:pyocin knob domain-containing protein [Weissella confusa]